MTLKELSQLYHLNREIEADQKRLAKLRLKAYSPSGINLSGMPSGGAYNNRLERLTAEIVDLEGIIEANIKRCIHERNRIERYISDIDDSLTRQIFTYRCVNGLNWTQVAMSIGGGNTEEGTKKRFYRHINKDVPKCPDCL